MRLIGRLLSVIIILGAVAALCPRADAGAFTYAGKRKRINCGIVAVNGTAIDPSTDLSFQNAKAMGDVVPGLKKNAPNNGEGPSLFTVLDALTAMKPTGWTLENPLAPTTDKYNPYYWIVNVSSSRNLSRMDVLYFPGAGTIKLSDDERENLRKFVDGGGVLWVDNADPVQVLKFDTNNPLFISQCQFSTGGLQGSDFPVSRHHPLLSSPFWMTDIDIMSLGMTVADSSWANCHYNMPGTDKPGGVLPTDEPASYDFLYQVIDSLDSTGTAQFQPAVVANTYGSGRVVATARFVGEACLLPEPYSMPDLKMAYNIMSYASSWTDIRKNPRHTGTSIDTLGNNRLVEKWAFLNDANGTDPQAAELNKENAPVIYKNTVFYTHGDTLYALDANGDNNFGTWGPPGPDGAVVIWSWTPGDGGTLSAPAVSTVQNPDPRKPKDTSPIEAVMVQSSKNKGMVYILDAFPLDASGIPANPIVPLYHFETQDPDSSTVGGTNQPSTWPSPPIYVNGWFYAVSGQGRLYADNPCWEKWLGSNTSPDAAVASPLWMDPDLTNNQNFKAIPRSGPAFGYMKGLYNGAIVGSVWWYDSPDKGTNATSTTPQNDHLWAVPVFVSNDRVKVMSRNGNTAELYVNFPGFIHAPDPMHTESTLRMFESDGITPINATSVVLNSRSGTPAAGYITVQATEPIPTSPRIYASYSLTYGPGGYMTSHDMEIDPKMPVSTSGSTMVTHNPSLITGAPAMGPDNMSYICATRAKQADSDGGSILAYQHDGSTTGVSKLRWHYFLHSGLDDTTGPAYIPGTTVQLPGVVTRFTEDPKTHTKFISGVMKHPEPSPSPAISNGKVFVTVSGDLDGTNPRGALLCLKANPEFVIRLTQAGGYDAAGKPIRSPKSLNREGDSGHYRVRIWQPNLINTSSGAAPMLDARDVTGGATVDYDNGTITFTDFGQPKLQVMGGVETNTFSPSLPVWVYLDTTEVPIDWSTWGPGAYVGTTPLTAATSDSVDLSGWNNLLWYYIVPDYKGTPCSGVHSPPTVIGNTVYFTTDDGVLYALDAETGESKGQQTTQKALWEQKIETEDPNATPSTLPAEASVSVAGSNGVLMVPGPKGLHAFTNTTTLVTDNNRLVELDGAGDASWSLDSITWPATTPSASGVQMAVKQGPVNKPGHARYASTGEILFANTGADQVCKVDKSGMVGFDGAMGLYARWIYEKFADPKHLLSSGQPTKLRGPTDAIMWQEMEPNTASQTAPTSVVHCLIADSGNSRILDLVYRMKAGSFVKWDGTALDPKTDLQYIDQESGFVLPELNWASKTDALNEKYSYNCMQLVNVVKNNNYCQDIWVASSDLASTGTDFATSPTGSAALGGAILAIGYRQRSSGARPTPGTGGSGGTGGVAAGNWDYREVTSGKELSGTVVARCDHIVMTDASGPTSTHKSVPLANPRYFEIVDSQNGRSLLICDNYGVYQISLEASDAINGLPPVVQHLWASDPRRQASGSTGPYDDYGQLGRLPNPATTITDTSCTNTLNPTPAVVPLPGAPPLIASSVQRMANHKWLITNSYVGSNTSGSQSFNGEVFEYDPESPATQQVLWCSPKLEWVMPDASAPPCTLPSAWRQVNSNTYNLRQPKSATRR